MSSFLLSARLRLARSVVVAVLALTYSVDGAAASPPTNATATRAAKRAAARHVRHLGLDYANADWTAFCLRWSRGSFACTVRTRGGQCHGRLVVYGSREHPRTRARHISCGE